MSLLSKLSTLNINKRNSSGIKLKGLRSTLLKIKFINTDIKPTDAGKYIPVYKFPYIKLMSTLNRLKFYQTVLTGFAIPISFVLNQVNIVNTEDVIAACITGFTGCVVFYSIGALCNKFVGIIYINESEDKAKLSYADFWGSRKDAVISVEDIVPISELPARPTDALYLIFRRYSTKETLRLNLKQSIILDQPKFNKIFGAL